MANLLLLLTLGIGLPAAFAFGMWMADRECRRMWTEHRYCPTCDRLRTEWER